ncbi:FkbM family methyltransferase [Flavitalea flava]
MQKSSSRWKLAINKLLFCLRVTADLKTGFRLMLNSKRYSRYQKKNGGPANYKEEKVQVYSIRYLSRDFILFLRTYSGDIQMFYEIFLEQVYRLPPGLIPIYLQHTEPDSTNPATLSMTNPLVIVDAGANIGMAAKYFSLVYPTARIFCIEPASRNFSVLQKNLAAEQAAGRAFFLEAALYEREGSIVLEDAGWSFNSKVREPGLEPGRGPDPGLPAIPAFTGKGLLDRFGLDNVDLLKMDIEGAEEGLFKGDTLWLDRVSAILIEIHTKSGIDLIKNKLTGQGFFWYPWQHSESAASLFLASKKELTGNS